ncbi:restriction endonuclease [Aliidiomarina indica]|uniref:restriction endonuclease n=1 Tax=Aliidiomarina indica TaxID=2749147 RepID=UPI00188EF349|nr:restriction endonuclease [Aliidiomarina indica]
MARKGLADDIFNMAKKLPWWISLFIAALSYIASPFMVDLLSAPSEEPIRNAISGAWAFVALILFKYALPIAFVFGAMASVVERARAKRVLSRTRNRMNDNAFDAPQALADISWRDFERLTAAYFREQGFQVQETDAGPDGGVDLELYKDSKLYLVQCKHWKTQHVPVQKVRELYGIMAAKGAEGGFFVASGNFTTEAKRFALDKNILLIHGADVLKTAEF